MTFFYYESEGVHGVARNSDTCRIEVRGTTVPIDYSTYKELRENPKSFKDKYEIKERMVKGKPVKTVEAKDVRQDSKQPKQDNPS